MEMLIKPVRCLVPSLLFGCMIVLLGCEPTYAPRKTLDLRPRVLQISDHHGGTRHCTLVHDDVWYQSLGPELVIHDSDRGLRITSVEIGDFGTVGPISDMVLFKGDLWVVYAFDRVVRFSLSNPRRPDEIRSWDVGDLGLYPLEISQADGRLWVSGRDGVTAMDDLGDVKLASLGRVGRVVNSPSGLLATSGRRVHQVDDGAYVGSASDLQPLPERFGVPGGLVFMLQSSKGATFGVMGPDVREIDSKTILGTVRSVRILDDRLFVLGDREMVSWRILPGGKLDDPIFIKVKGSRDIALLRENYYAVGGTFGQAIFRLKGDANGDADEFLNVERTPGRLEQAITDGQRVLAGGVEGNWLYSIGGKPELSDKTLDATTTPRTVATLTWGEASIDAERYGVTIRMNDGTTQTWSPRGKGLVYTLEVAEDRLWIGHDEGIEVLEADRGQLVKTGSVRLEGPVAWLFRPRVGENVAYVSVYGGMGSAEVVPDPDAPEDMVQRVRPEDLERTERELRKKYGLELPEDLE